MKSITLREKDIVRFWSKVKIGKPDECWEWMAHKNNMGYGVVGIKSELFICSRVSWTIKFGDIAEKMCVCHKCDNPACVNPNHLFLGTMKENMADKMEKGRYVRGTVLRGEAHTLAKLSESDIPIIRRMYDDGITTRKIGKKFGVDSKTIWSVGKRISWHHIKSEG